MTRAMKSLPFIGPDGTIRAGFEPGLSAPMPRENRKGTNDK